MEYLPKDDSAYPKYITFNVYKETCDDVYNVFHNSISTITLKFEDISSYKVLKSGLSIEICTDKEKYIVVKKEANENVIEFLKKFRDHYTL